MQADLVPLTIVSKIPISLPEVLYIVKELLLAIRNIPTNLDLYNEVYIDSYGRLVILTGS